jgi:GDPmannose 4,6-dehydratase
MSKTALITGITGQDGSYLAEFLLNRGYLVYGLMRRSSSFNTSRINHIYQDPHEPNPGLRLIYGDLNDGSSLNKILRDVQPDEIYNLGAQSHVMVSFDNARIYGRSDWVGHGAAVRGYSKNRDSAEVLPSVIERAIWTSAGNAAKRVHSFLSAQPVRVRQGIRIPHGSQLPRSLRYVCLQRDSVQSRKPEARRNICDSKNHTRGDANHVGLQDKLYLGNLAARRDWGYAPEYVEVMWLMLQQETADDYVVASGETHSVEEFVEEAFGLLGLNWRKHVEIDRRYIRPTEVDLLLGDYSKAKTNLRWKPKVAFKDLVRIMVEADLELARREAHMNNFKEQVQVKAEEGNGEHREQVKVKVNEDNAEATSQPQPST